MNLAICDDQPEIVQTLKAIVDEWKLSTQDYIDVHTFNSAESLLFEMDSADNYQIILLDIDMPGLSGIDCAKRIRSFSKTTQIIFVTGYTDYLAQGYDVEALHYLVKPIDKDKLITTLNRALSKLKDQDKCLIIGQRQTTVALYLKDIKYIEVMRNYITIHADKDYTAKMTLKSILPELDDRFVKINRSMMVNLTFISKITKTDVYLKSGDVLPLSKGNYDTLNQKMIHYF